MMLMLMLVMMMVVLMMMTGDGGGVGDGGWWLPLNVDYVHMWHMDRGILVEQKWLNATQHVPPCTS